MKNTNIGIFSGTFDPFTPAHYEIVNAVLNKKLVDKVIILPTIVDYYRKDKNLLFDENSKIKIIKTWFEDRDDVILDFYEYEFKKWVVNTFDDDVFLKHRRYFHMLEDIHLRYGDNKYFSIIGGDSWNNLETWYKWDDLVKLSDFIVVERDNSSLTDYHICERKDYAGQPVYTFRLNSDVAILSATQIRKHLEDACSGMSMGPNSTWLNIYLDEIDDYKKNKKTYLDREQDYDKLMQVVKDNLQNKEKLIAHTPIFDLVEGSEVEEGFKPVKVKSPDWVSIIVENNDEFLMVNQHRHGLDQDFEEFPCGMVEKNELHVDAARRELREETGIDVRSPLTYLGSLAANPAFMTNYMHYFYVNLNEAEFMQVKTNLDAHEHLTSYWKIKYDAKLDFLSTRGSSLMAGAWFLLTLNKFI